MSPAGLKKSLWKMLTRIIAVSSAMERDVMELYGIAPERIRVIYNGIDLRRFQKVDKPDIVASYGIDPHRPYVLFVGRITHQKGILHLVDALPRLVPETQVLYAPELRIRRK